MSNPIEESTAEQRAWEIVASMVDVLSGRVPEGRVSISVPTDPVESGQLVEALARISAVQIIGASEGEPDGYLSRLRVALAGVPRPVTEADLPDEELQRRRQILHYGPDGPVGAVHALFRSIIDNDADAWWELLDGELKLVRVQAWLWNNPTSFDVTNPRREALAWEFVDRLHESWEEFAQIELAQLQSAWAKWIELWETDRLGAGSESRIIGPDTELVVLVPTPSPGAQIVFMRPTQVEALTFTVRHDGARWRVRAYGSEPHQPGWPPHL